MTEGPDQHNPYIGENGEPRLRRSVVTFIDILGYTEAIRRAVNSKRSQEFLEQAKVAFRKAYEHVKPIEDELIFDRHPYYLKAFADNIVVGYPILAEGELELGVTYLNLQLFQLSLVRSGFFVRGAVAVGDLYLDADLAYGEALLEAHDAERSLSRDPRILMTKSAIEYVQEHMTYYMDPTSAPQYYDLLRDSDGQLFINYLEVLDDPVDGPFNEALMDHKAMVESMLKEYSNEPRIWTKYVWVANYHNYFCENSQLYKDPDFTIALDDYQLRPTRIE